MIQSGGFLGRLLGLLLKTGFSLIKNVINQSVLIPLGLTTAASTADAGIHKIILGSGHRPSDSSSQYTIQTLSNDEIEDIIKIVEDY